MTITVDFWYLVGLLLGFFGVVFLFGKLLLGQIDRRITESITSLAEAEKHTSDRVAGLERDLMAMRAELPTRYVMREDYVRGQSLIEAKLDALYNRNEAMKSDLINKIEAIWKGKP